MRNFPHVRAGASLGFGFCLLLTGAAAAAQMGAGASPTAYTVETLDPVRAGAAVRLESATHTPLPEEYIWTGDSASAKTGQSGDGLGWHYFRRVFMVDRVPKTATLYVAGPRKAKIYLNGELIRSFQANQDSRVVIRVIPCDLSGKLRQGSNVLAIEAVRGEDGRNRGSRAATQQGRGEVLVVKIVPAALGVNAPALLISDAQWKAASHAAAGWEGMGFEDRNWPRAVSLGGIESTNDFFQWNADAGLYDWPGYDGISPYLAQYRLAPVAVSHAYAGLGELSDVDALLKPEAAGAEFRVKVAAERGETHPPQVLVDFGREVSGRLAITSDSDEPADVTVQYGESKSEALDDPYMGVLPLHVAPHTTAYGPKSAFRFALVRFTGGRDTRYKSIELAGIDYPVKYRGYFDSSDPALNKMWAVGAYTAHLCMQDGIWDAPKRDRARWMGDLDVSGRTIEDVFGDRFLMDETMDKLIGPAPVTENVNGIAGYSAFWVMGEAEYYRHMGSKEQLASVHQRLVELLHFMETELDQRNLYANRTNSWPFVDWSPELNGDTPEARRATQFEFYKAFEDGVYLLRELGDTANADLFAQRAAEMKAAAQKHLLDASGSFGTRWQTNAFAVFSGAAEPSQYDAIWRNSLASVGHVKYNALIITPYYNYYVVSAMAEMGHRKAALDWIRQYWGGMIGEGATSFWEGYDPSWYKYNFHASLQGDNQSGYILSLAHGWSSGVTPWLMEQVLGIRSRGAGFSQVEMRPDLIDLAWAKGGEPTPRGMLQVSLTKTPAGALETAIDLPPGTEARVLIPVTGTQARVMVNGKAKTGAPAENGKRAVVTLSGAGHYVLRAE